MMDRIFNGPVDFETAVNLTAQAPALYQWDTFAEKNKVGGRAGSFSRPMLNSCLWCYGFGVLSSLDPLTGRCRRWRP